MPAKAKSGRLSSSANHVGVFRGFVSAHSQKELTGTKHRLSGTSQLRQCGLFVLRMLVTVAPPNFGGPRHAPTHHLELALTVCRADDRRQLIREDVGQAGRLSVRSRAMAKNRRMAFWARVML